MQPVTRVVKTASIFNSFYQISANHDDRKAAGDGQKKAAFNDESSTATGT
jgi:hypothetical protein